MKKRNENRVSCENKFTLVCFSTGHKCNTFISVNVPQAPLLCSQVLDARSFRRITINRHTHTYARKLFTHTLVFIFTYNSGKFTPSGTHITAHRKKTQVVLMFSVFCCVFFRVDFVFVHSRFPSHLLGATNFTVAFPPEEIFRE